MPRIMSPPPDRPALFKAIIIVDMFSLAVGIEGESFWMKMQPPSTVASFLSHVMSLI